MSDLLGITHWNPDAEVDPVLKVADPNRPKRKLKYPKTWKGWFYYLVFHALAFLGYDRARKHIDASMSVEFTRPVYDVEAYKNYTRVFQEGEFVVVTEKIHGSNARFLFLDGTMYVGSRNQWKATDSSCSWRKALADNDRARL